jgi:hypothetical protein
MGRNAVLVVALLAGGCAEHTHSRHTLAHDIGKPELIPPPPELVVAIEASTIHVQATRACRAPTSDVVVDTLHVKSANANPDPTANSQEDGRGAAILGLVAAVISAIDVAANDGKVTVKREKRPDEEVLCPASVRQVVVEVDLPSGLKLTGRTDDTGAVDLEIPPTEIAEGTLSVSAPGMKRQIVRYSRPATP